MNKKVPILFAFLLSLFIANPTHATSYFDVNRDELVDFAQAEDFNGSDDAKADTIKRMQNMVKAVAQEYAYKGTYTDYEQKNMDVAKVNGMSNTMAFRNFNMNPFVLSRSKTIVFDCSSFVTNVYMNAFGYSFDDLMDRSSLYYLEAPDVYTKITKSNYRNPLLNSGKGVSTALLQKQQRKNKNLNGPNSLFVKTYEKGSGYYGPSDVDNMVSELNNVMQTGDILLIRRSSPENKVSSGHVLIYVKDYTTQAKNSNITSDQVDNLVTVGRANGFIHSTGKEYPMDTVASNEVEEYGDTDTSVHFGSIEKYLANALKEDKYVNYISVLRPINIIAKGDYENIYTKQRNSLKTTKNIMALSNMPQITMQQYMYNRTDSEYVRSTNTIRVGDVIRVKNYFKYRGGDANGIRFNVSYPVASKGFTHADKQFYWYSGKYKKKVTGRTYENNTLTYSITLYPGQYITTYYDVTYTGAGVISDSVSIPGIVVSYGDNSGTHAVKFDDMVARVSSYDNKTLLAGFDYYYGRRNSEKRKTSLYEAYQEVTGYDLSKYFNYSSSKTFAQNTKNMIFSYLEYDTGGSTFKENATRGMRKKANSKAESVILDGYYGGTMVRSDAKGERVRKPSFNDLEPGDLVIVYSHKKEKEAGIISSPSGDRSKYAFVYLGKKTGTNEDGTKVEYPVCYYEISGEVVKTIKTSDYKIRRLLAEDSFIVVRPSQAKASVSLKALAYNLPNGGVVEEVESDDDIVDEKGVAGRPTANRQETGEEVVNDSDESSSGSEDAIEIDEEEIDSSLDEIRSTDIIDDSADSQEKQDNGLNMPLIIVILVGGFVLLAGIITAIVVIIKKKKKNSSNSILQ